MVSESHNITETSTNQLTKSRNVGALSSAQIEVYEYAGVISVVSGLPFITPARVLNSPDDKMRYYTYDISNRSNLIK